MACLIGVLVSACGDKPVRVYQDESFKVDTPFQYYSSKGAESACEVGKRALLSQGYQLDVTQPQNVRGEKYFQPVSGQVSKLSISLVCLPSSLGAVIYATAMETHFELKAAGNTAGFSVTALGSVNLPWSADKNTLTKMSEVTVTDTAFYERLFDLIKSMDE